MKRLFTEGDVVRWEKAKSASLAIHQEKLATNNLPPQKVDFHLGMLSLTYETLGMIHIARKEFEKAVASFHACVETRCQVFERFEHGIGTRATDAGHFQVLLIAHVTKNDALISKFLRLYRTDQGIPESVYLGKLLVAISRQDFPVARTILQEKQPRLETQFSGYPACLAAMVQRDRQGFIEAFALAATKWAKWTSRVERGLPGSVCFIQGVGLIHIAEKIFGEAIPITNEHVPPELLK